MDAKLISKCGIYCGACYVYRAFKDRGKMLDETAQRLKVPKEETRCNGCSGPAEDLWRNCRICHVSACLNEKGFRFCYECPAFEDSSCPKYERLRQGALRRGENTKEALLRIKAGDADGWLEEQDRKWRCTTCGSPIWWEQKTCYHCGQPISKLVAREVVALSKKIVTRDVVIKALVDALRPLDYVHAFYESGAIAFNRLDEWSDIDLYLVVDDEKVDDSFAAVEAALRSVSPIKQKFAIPQLPWPGVSQAFYKLERASEFLLIDLAVIKLTGPEKFLAPEIHGKATFYFNKSDRVKVPSADKEELSKSLQQRFSRLRDRFAMFNTFVQKEMNRGNYLEALVLYHSLTLGSVVDALRIKYSPFHHDFKTRYMQYELPKHVVERIEELYFVKDGKDLRKKYREATEWFKAIAKESTGK